MYKTERCSNIDYRYTFFCGLTFIRNLRDEQKTKYLKEIKAHYGMDAEDISNMFTHNSEFTYVNFARMDTSGRNHLF